MSQIEKTGRLVLNHSTHIAGLLPVLEQLAQYPGIKTITPGRLASVKGRPSSFKIRVTVPVSGGYKLQARSQGSVQEVFVVTNLDANRLQKALDSIIKK
jgi:hypothetical protein